MIGVQHVLLRALGETQTMEIRPNLVFDGTCTNGGGTAAMILPPSPADQPPLATSEVHRFPTVGATGEPRKGGDTGAPIDFQGVRLGGPARPLALYGGEEIGRHDGGMSGLHPAV